MPEAIPELVWFALLLFGFALAWSARKVVEALFNPIIAVASKVPGLGGVLSSALSSIEQAITGALGSVVHGIDKLMGASWHRLAELNLWLWHEFVRHAQLLGIISPLLSQLVHWLLRVTGQIHSVTRAHDNTAARVKTLEREYHGIEHQIRDLQRELGEGIGSDIRVKLNHLEQEITGIETRTIPAIQQADSDAASAISNLYDWIKGKADIIGAGTFVGAVTAALALVGNGWLSCKENPFSSSKNPCGLWANLARFLPGLALLGIAFDFEAFCDAAETVAEGIGTAVGDIEGSFALELPPLPPPGA